jgi:glycosyltransferase involved in cell wall biosynthesis
MVKQKKVIMITSNFPYGGASANLLRNLALGLSESNNSVEVIIPHGHAYGKFNPNSKRKGKIQQVTYRYLCFLNRPRNGILKILEFFCSLLAIATTLIKRTIQNQVDVIVSYNASFFQTALLIVIKAITRKKLIIILPEFYEMPAKKYSVDYVQWFGFYLSISKFVKHADGFVVLSRYLESFIKEASSAKKKILLMPNIIDPERFNVRPVDPFIADKVTIGYTGTAGRKDGIHDLIRSFCILNRKYPNTHLLVIGDKPNKGSRVPALKELASELGILNDITFMGLVEHGKIPGLLNSCQILALTRPNGVFAEAGFPTKLGEYFACRKPVLLTKVGDMREYFFDNNAALMVEPENIDSIANGLEKLFVDKSLADELANNGYDWMNQNLNYKIVAKKIDDFIESLMVS